uniref:Mce/MlaD domain-containing protein n=1 Tax=Tetradesmus obliquus TaxID=3088 RepID=A0A383WFZ2_TETOB|eukprot:jgi/Sobl393_1/1818/SZX76173.1
MQIAQGRSFPVQQRIPPCVHGVAGRTSLRTLRQHSLQSRRLRSSIARGSDPEHEEQPVVPQLAASEQPQQEQQQQQSKQQQQKQQQQQLEQQKVPAQQGQQQQPQPQQPHASQQQPQQSLPQQQQQQQQQRTQQAQQPPPPPSRQQRQPATPTPPPPRPRQPHWLQQLLSGLQRTPATLIAFILGGCAVLSLLWGWAKGNPMRRSSPYSFAMSFREASKLEAGTPVRMKGVQIGSVTRVVPGIAAITAYAEVPDSGNIIPRGSRVDINLLGLASDPWIDITPPAGCLVRKEHGPHHPECPRDSLIVCDGGHIQGSQGGSTDFMMKFFLSQHDRTRLKVVEDWYAGSSSSSSRVS